MYVVFSAAPTLTSLAIRVATRSVWSHVDMLWDDGVLMGSVARKEGPYEAGVQKLTLEERLKYTQINRYKIDRFDLPDEAAARAFVEAQLGKPYDWGGAFAVPVWHEREWQRDDRWFCSELLAAAAQAGGAPIARLESFRVTPEMVERSPMLSTYMPVKYM